MNALALIIGNANYANPKLKLLNAVNDANDIAAKLLNLGFVVKKVTDCSVEAFDRAVGSFGEELKKFDVGLFYFSGHGLQIKGKNYLTSIDTNFSDGISVEHSSCSIDEVIQYMQDANATIKILILDACRDNPFTNIYRGVKQEGLAPIHAPQGTIIAFSTSPGEKAQDYGFGRNSIYTGSLLNHIDDENIPIEEFFKRVRTSVYSLSKEKQTSWEHTSLIGSFCFNSGQLVHSIDLPYKTEYIADENFQSTGSDIDKVIEGLKSHTFGTQNAALNRLSGIPISTIDESSQFLLGRNILQTAAGGEFSAEKIIKNLSHWLLKYSIGNTNHVLNGILYEIYFNSKGQFRQHDFKNAYLEEIFSLQGVEKFKPAFEFITKQLSLFKELFPIYLPTNPPTTLPIEVIFETFDLDVWHEGGIGHKLLSVKHEENELLEPYTEDRFSTTLATYEQFVDKLRREFCIPQNRLRLSMNVKRRHQTYSYALDFKIIKTKGN